MGSSYAPWEAVGTPSMYPPPKSLQVCVLSIQGRLTDPSGLGEASGHRVLDCSSISWGSQGGLAHSVPQLILQRNKGLASCQGELLLGPTGVEFVPLLCAFDP